MKTKKKEYFKRLEDDLQSYRSSKIFWDNLDGSFQRIYQDMEQKERYIKNEIITKIDLLIGEAKNYNNELNLIREVIDELKDELILSNNLSGDNPDD